MLGRVWDENYNWRTWLCRCENVDSSTSGRTRGWRGWLWRKKKYVKWYGKKTFFYTTQRPVTRWWRVWHFCLSTTVDLRMLRSRNHDNGSAVEWVKTWLLVSPQIWTDACDANPIEIEFFFVHMLSRAAVWQVWQTWKGSSSTWLSKLVVPNLLVVLSVSQICTYRPKTYRPMKYQRILLQRRWRHLWWSAHVIVG